MKHLTKTLLAIALLLCLAPGVRAQDFLPYPGGVTLVTRDFDPAHPGDGILKPVFGDPNLLRQVVNTAWQSARAPVADQIKAQMGQANSVAKGVTPYNIACTMGQPGDLSVKPGSYANGSTLEMKYLVRGNWIEFDTTQPTDLGKWADPRFSCTYDLTLTLSMSLGDAPGPLRMTSVKAEVSNSKLDSHGLIADLVFIGNSVAKLFGENFIKKAQAAINGKKFDFTDKLNQSLAPFNAMLADIEKQGYGLANSLLNAPQDALPGGLRPASLPGATPQSPQLVMFLESDGKIPTRGAGEISGAIRWKKALGEPAGPVIAPGAKALGRISTRHPFGRGFRIRAIAQSGFGKDGMFTPPMTEVGVLKSVSLDQAASGGDDYVLRYVVDQLPLNIPIKVEVAMADVAWQGDVGAGQQRLVGPQGWSGVITLKPGRQLVVESAMVKAGLGEMAMTAGGATPGAAPGTETSIIIVSGKGAKGRQLGKRSRIAIPGQGAASAGEAVELNPQPLPPEPDPDAVRASAPRLSVRNGSVRNGSVRNGSVRNRVGILKRSTPGGLSIDAPATPIGNRSGSLDVSAAQRPRLVIDNPTGTMAVSGIDFEVGLVTGPR